MSRPVAPSSDFPIAIQDSAIQIGVLKLPSSIKHFEIIDLTTVRLYYTPPVPTIDCQCKTAEKTNALAQFLLTYTKAAQGKPNSKYFYPPLLLDPAPDNPKHRQVQAKLCEMLNDWISSGHPPQKFIEISISVGNLLEEGLWPSEETCELPPGTEQALDEALGLSLNNDIP